jgi:hypothetical protein
MKTQENTGYTKQRGVVMAVMYFEEEVGQRFKNQTLPFVDQASESVVPRKSRVNFPETLADGCTM